MTATASHTSTAKQIEVGQGELQVSSDPQTELVATLGSCVSVCLFSPEQKVGGMNHIFQYVSSETLGDAGVVAEVERLVNELAKVGAPRNMLKARVTGGGQVFLRTRRLGLAIADACLNYLEGEKIELVGVSVGGENARRIRFNPVSGQLVVGTISRPVEETLPAPDSGGNEVEMF